MYEFGTNSNNEEFDLDWNYTWPNKLLNLKIALSEDVSMSLS